jgi:uncharacterized membrane protein
MEITIKDTALYISIVLTGLSAGFFYAWQVSVIPGTKLIQDYTYIETMQKINRAIINLPFMLIFLGPVLIQVLCIVLYWDTTLPFWMILISTLTYGLGTVVVTGTGNVPLNDALDRLKLSEMSKEQIASERKDYEAKWNRLHLIRTLFAVLSFMLLLAAVFVHS